MTLKSVKVPKEMEPLFARAEEVVSAYFKARVEDPSKGTIEISGDRYVLVRAAALSVEFFELVRGLFGRGREAEAREFALNLLYDLSHAIGIADARSFHVKMKLEDPIAKLSAGPVHFSYSGWAFVDISSESRPSPDENFLLVYDHPYTFESDAWLKSGKEVDFPVCIMNAGYSSGWCTESFGVPLVSSEILCRARGDKCCRFIMAHSAKIESYIERYSGGESKLTGRLGDYEIPDFFARKRFEEELEGRVKDLQRVKEELKERNMELKEFDRVRSDFLAYVAHELRGPLATIMGGLKLVSDGIYGPINEKQHRAIEIADNNVGRLVRIVNNLLDISRIDAGKLKVHRERIDLAILVRQVVALELTAAEAKGVSIEARVPDRPVELNADSDAIIQVLTNLAGNAIKFTDAGGITITLVDRKDEVELSVGDTGIGISSDDLSGIFDRYKQVGKKEMSRGKGTGLGLSIARGIVEAHGGTIEVASESGKGTTFTIILPKE